jgi:LysM repeat protein
MSGVLPGGAHDASALSPTSDSTKSYVVQHGDTLAGIAAEHGVGRS